MGQAKTEPGGEAHGRSPPGRAIVWSEAAERLFALSGPTAVSAGAGSGKTTCLVELCVRLLSGEATGTPCDPSEIAAITFTEKAAAELGERLREAVAARACSASDGSGAGDDERTWRVRLHELERMAIGTIHGFAGRLLREHALEAGLDPNLEVLDEDTSQGWRREAARDAVVAALDAQRAAAQVLAAAHGAGGRRSGLADVVAEIARERATYGETQPIEPVPDAVGEAVAARADALAAAGALLATRGDVRTASGTRALAHLASAVLRFEEVDRGGPPCVEALRRAADVAAAVRGWRVGSSDGESARALKDDLVLSWEAFRRRAAEALAGPQKRELCSLVAEAEARYAARKRAAQALDFDDLLVWARDLLRSDAGLRAELRGRLRALLVDEYQDVNSVQQEIFELLTGGESRLAGISGRKAGEGVNGAGHDSTPWLVAVGDLKQSIYRFRGADVAVFAGVLDRLVAPPARVLHLAQNHRSSPGVLELVNEVFSRCMQPSSPVARPYELSFRDADRLVPVRTGGQRPACEILEDGEEGNAAERRPREARALAARIQALVSGAAGVEVRERQGAGDGNEERGRRPRYGDVAVLFRRLTQIGEYERALRGAGIPYRLARGGGFYQASEVRDLGELLASLSEPEDAFAWAALLRSPMCGLGEGALFAVSRLGLARLARRAPEEVVLELVRMYPAAAQPWPFTPNATSVSNDLPASTEVDRLRRFLTEWHGLHAHRGRLSLPDLLLRAVERLDLEAAYLASPDGERRLVNLRKALAMAARFASRGGTLAGFADRLRTMATRPPREPEAELEVGDAVALLSVHQAKGLEWPIVFVPDLGATPPRDGRRALRDRAGALAAAFFDPVADAHHTTTALAAAREEARRAGAAESRRLLYVALTRARDRLVLSGEAGRGGETWRELLEAGVAARPDLVVRIPLKEAATFASAARPGAGEPEELFLRAGAAAVPTAPRDPRLAPGQPRPEVVLAPAVTPPFAAVRVAVTELAEHALCPRRVFLARRLGLPEREPDRRGEAALLVRGRPWGVSGGPAQDDPDRATARGTLAHAMIAEVELGAPPLERRAQLAAAAGRRGYDPHSRGVRRIIADVARFLDSAPGLRLTRAAAAGALRREVPFLLRLDGDGMPSCYLVGAVDALVEERKAVVVLDFKYAMARAGAGERYRFQLLAYALAASRALPGRKVTVSLQFLRGSFATIDLAPSPADLHRFAREVPRLAAAAHGGADLSRSPEELGRDEARCRQEGCGYVRRCHGVGRRTGCAPTPDNLP
jgi:ATP-dependent exoDNAse (exonuclease V) beta subunit